MKYKVNQTVEYYCDLNDKYYLGVIKSINPIDENYLVAFLGGSFWIDENDLRVAQ